MIDPKIETQIQRLIEVQGGIVPRGVLEQLRLLGAMATVVKFETAQVPCHFAFAGKDLPAMVMWMIGDHYVTVTVDAQTAHYWARCVTPGEQRHVEEASGTDVPALVDWIVEQTGVEHVGTTDREVI